MDRQALRHQLKCYRAQLAQLRASWQEVYHLPEAPFFLFGMGYRPKLIYRDGILRDARTGNVLYKWIVREEMIIPPEYTVYLETTGGTVILREDECNIWLNGQSLIPGVGDLIQLPSFEPSPYNLVLKVLHQEILVNIVDGRPVPNFFVYSRPWYRDSAMMAMVLQESENLHLLRDWILSLDDPFDRNNAGETEADNLGQALWLLSLVSDKNHPLVSQILMQLPAFTQGTTLTGRTDFVIRPVYQTEWIKFGLKALNLPDPYQIPLIYEDYSALFWWDFNEQHIDGERMISCDYPYLTWACDSFYKEHNAAFGDRDYPLSWEAKASQAKYSGMAIIDPEYVQRQLAVPHTWHAAEMFLRLMYN